jgi:hypothetical protein
MDGTHFDVIVGCNAVVVTCCAGNELGRVLDPRVIQYCSQQLDSDGGRVALEASIQRLVGGGGAAAHGSEEDALRPIIGMILNGPPMDILTVLHKRDQIV